MVEPPPRFATRSRMLHLRGAPAFSPSRSAKLLETLQAQDPAVTEVRAEFVHFAKVSSPA